MKGWGKRTCESEVDKENTGFLGANLNLQRKKKQPQEKREGGGGQVRKG